jgi:hypothetical protein
VIADRATESRADAADAHLGTTGLPLGVPHPLGVEPWGPPRLGYRRTDDGHWEPDPATRPLRQRLFAEAFERGGTTSSIAKKLALPDSRRPVGRT